MIAPSYLPIRTASQTLPSPFNPPALSIRAFEYEEKPCTTKPDMEIADEWGSAAGDKEGHGKPALDSDDE